MTAPINRPWSLGAVMRILESAEHHCETCRNYAWGGSSTMWPVVDAQGVTHHPSCSTLPDNQERDRRRGIPVNVAASPMPALPWTDEPISLQGQVVRSTLGPRGAGR